MKFVTALFAFVLTSQVFAAGEFMTCKETNHDPAVAPLTLVLTKIGVAPMREGHKLPYKLELFQGVKKTKVLSTRVTVETEDVMFGFENKSLDLSGMIYMDELDQTHMTIGRNEYRFNCY